MATKATPKPKRPTKRPPHWSGALKQLGACAAGLRWARRQETYAKAWAKCGNPDYLNWLVEEICGWTSVEAVEAFEAQWNESGGAIAECHAIRSAVARPKLPKVGR